MDICNAKKLAAMPPGLARKNFSIEMERTVRELNGIPCKGWDEARADKQQINSTRSVGERITDIQSLHQALAKHVGIAAAKLRSQGSVCGVMFAFANNSPFDEQPAGFKQVIRFPVPIDDTAVMTSAVSRIVPQLYRPGIRYYKIGIGLLDLSPASKTQLDLFNQTPGDSRLMSALDSLNYRYGTDTLFLAAQGIQQKWTMRRELLTPQYTTDWHHIPKIHC